MAKVKEATGTIDLTIDWTDPVVKTCTAWPKAMIALSAKGYDTRIWLSPLSDGPSVTLVAGAAPFPMIVPQDTPKGAYQAVACKIDAKTGLVKDDLKQVPIDITDPPRVGVGPKDDIEDW
jgi:hypothetical protein